MKLEGEIEDRENEHYSAERGNPDGGSLNPIAAFAPVCRGHVVGQLLVSSELRSNIALTGYMLGDHGRGAKIGPVESMVKPPMAV
jgi:hypothetical protein